MVLTDFELSYIFRNSVVQKRKIMEIPIYSQKDLYQQEMEGDYFNSDFAEFLDVLLERGEIEDETELGIAKKVSAEGTHNLSDKQRYHIQNIYNRYNNKRCDVCDEKIPINEVLHLMNEKLCSYHQNFFDND
jgi:CRISPR/Cas system-associated protein Cas10 (large subunit of type III CRISPR-Cas system)